MTTLKGKILGDRVLIEESKEEAAKTELGNGVKIDLVQTDDKNQAVSRRGIVVSVGPGNKDIKPEGYEVGSEVLFNFGEPISIDGDVYQIVRMADISWVF